VPSRGSSSRLADELRAIDGGMKDPGAGGGHGADLEPPLDEEEDVVRGITLVAEIGPTPVVVDPARPGELPQVGLRDVAERRRAAHDQLEWAGADLRSCHDGQKASRWAGSRRPLSATRPGP
jgi:hypothetical protein